MVELPLRVPLHPHARLRTPVASALLFALASLVSWTLSGGVGAADSERENVRTVRTRSGVSFTLPARFVPVGELAVAPVAQLSLEQAFVDTVSPSVRVLVYRAAIDVDPTLRALPTRSGPLPPALASGLVDGLQSSTGVITARAGRGRALGCSRALGPRKSMVTSQPGLSNVSTFTPWARASEAVG